MIGWDVAVVARWEVNIVFDASAKDVLKTLDTLDAIVWEYRGQLDTVGTGHQSYVFTQRSDALRFAGRVDSIIERQDASMGVDAPVKV